MWGWAYIAAVATALIANELIAALPRFAKQPPSAPPTPKDYPLTHSGNGFSL